MMKKFFIGLFLLGSVSVFGQYSNTLYFLENSPFRHTINPAFMPISRVYVALTPLAYMNMSLHSSLGYGDFLQNKGNKTVTALYDQSTRNNLLKSLKKSGNRFVLDANFNLNLLSFGFKIKEKHYIHFNVSERVDVVGYLPYNMFKMILDKGMKNFTGNNSFSLSRFGVNGSIYTEFAGGYTQKINEQWSIGGKLKILLGTAYMGLKSSSLQLNASYSKWNFNGDGSWILAGPFNLPYYIDRSNIGDIFSDENMQDDFRDIIRPKGGGFAVDFGAVYRPFKLLQTSFAITDLGFIAWNKNVRKYNYKIQGQYAGLNDKVDMQAIWETIRDIGKNLLTTTRAEERYIKMIRAKLNVGADLMLANDKIDIGLYSKTDFLGKYITEEITLGTAFRPAKWFNFAMTYSFVGANWDCIGMGLTLMPKDGLQLLLAADYIPLTYAKIKEEDIEGQTILPYKMKNFDLSFGVAIVIGSYEKKKKELEPPKMWSEKEKKRRKIKNDNKNPYLSQKDRFWQKKRY